LPWWWAGTSIAATTFAADTPLAITGIVADRGLSGNWLWLSWIGVHAAVIVYFASKWRRSRALTDAELIQLRYSGPTADALRVLRALLYAFVYNAIHFNWGASYVVNDLYLRWRPQATPEQQVRLARLSVIGFAALSVVVALHIDTIEQAWKWVAFIGAALGRRRRSGGSGGG